jgi:hypothetical protein
MVRCNSINPLSTMPRIPSGPMILRKRLARPRTDHARFCIFFAVSYRRSSQLDPAMISRRIGHSHPPIYDRDFRFERALPCGRFCPSVIPIRRGDVRRSTDVTFRGGLSRPVLSPFIAPFLDTLEAAAQAPEASSIVRRTSSVLFDRTSEIKSLIVLSASALCWDRSFRAARIGLFFLARTKSN